MIVLTGDTGSKNILKRMKEVGIGRIFANQFRTPYEGEKWALDNNAYTSWVNHKSWRDDKYAKIVTKFYSKGLNPYFAVIPDKPVQKDSMDFSLDWIECLPDKWNWYFVLQNGMEVNEVEDKICSLKKVKGLFLGGDHEFKEKCGAKFVTLAKKHKLKFHYARTSNVQRMVDAYDMGSDSCDSSFFLWNKTRLDAVIRLIQDDFKTTNLRLAGSYVISEEVR